MIATLLLLACTGPEPSGAQRVRLALNWYPEPEFGGFYEGLLSGTYARAGFDVEILPGGPGAPTLELLATGQAEVAITAADDLLIKRRKGASAVGVWPVFQLTPQGLMVHAEGGPRGFEDIQGGRVAIEPGSPFQTLLWRRFGWEGKVEAVPYGGAIGPFLADPAAIQQAFITSEPCLAEARGAKVRFLKASDAGWNPYGALVAVADPPPPWAGAFVAATAQAWRDYLARPEAANLRIAELNDQLSPELMACISDAQRPFLEGEAGMGAMDAARWEATAAALVGLGLLPAGSRAEGAWVTLEAAAAPPR